MTNREREFAKCELEYAEGIEQAATIRLPSGREVRKVRGKWEAQPHNDNYWKSFDDLLDAVKFAVGQSQPTGQHDLEQGIPHCETCESKVTEGRCIDNACPHFAEDPERFDGMS